jgi:hypothetical protein
MIFLKHGDKKDSWKFFTSNYGDYKNRGETGSRCKKIQKKHSKNKDEIHDGSCGECKRTEVNIQELNIRPENMNLFLFWLMKSN